MASRRFARKPPEPLCSEPGPGDGADPRFDPKGPRGKVANRKALQLCRQVQQTLSGALEGELLRDLVVESVVPAPDSARLLVTLRYHGNASTTPAAIQAALADAHPKLRAEIAAAIHRKKTPELVFQVVR